MLGDLFDIMKDLIKEVAQLFWTLLTEISSVIWADFRPIVFALLAMALLWYIGGGYDNAEKYYQSQHNSASQQNQNATPPPADGTVYIIK